MATKGKNNSLTKHVLYQVRFDVGDPRKLARQIESAVPKGGFKIPVSPAAPKSRDPRNAKAARDAGRAIARDVARETGREMGRLKIKAPDVKVNIDLDSAFGKDDVDKLGRSVGASLQRSIGNVFSGLSGKALGAMGLGGFSFFTLASQAHDYNQELVSLRNSFAQLSNEYGNAGKAMSTYYGAFGGSIASLGTIKGSMMSLNAAGITPMDDGFKSLTRHVSDLTVASGIGQDALAGMTGELMANWKYSEKGTREMLSSMIALGDGFDMTMQQVEATMGTVRKSINELGAFFKNGERDAKALARGIGMATAALRKMGVSAQTVNQFMENILDPNNFSQNQALFAQLGISYRDQMAMWETAEGKMQFMQKMLSNLPRLSQQLMGIRDPFARMDFAKTLGVPLEIVQKLGKASGSEISLIMRDYMGKSGGEDAAEKKKRQAAAEAERFNDSLHLMRMKIMTPLMNWLNSDGYKMMWKFMNTAAPLAQKLMGHYTDIIKMFADNVAPALDKFANGNWAGAVAGLVGGAIKTAAHLVGKAIVDGVPALAKGLWNGFWEASPLAKVFAVLAAAGIFFKSYAMGNLAIQGHLKTIIALLSKNKITGGFSPLDLVGWRRGGKLGRNVLSVGGRAAVIGSALYAAHALTKDNAYESYTSGKFDPNAEMNGAAAVDRDAGFGNKALDAASVGDIAIKKGATRLAAKVGFTSLVKAIPVLGWVVGGTVDAVYAWMNADREVQRQLTYTAKETQLLGKTIFMNTKELSKYTWNERRAIAEARAKAGIKADTNDKIAMATLNVVTLGLAYEATSKGTAKNSVKRQLGEAQLREYAALNAFANEGERDAFKKHFGAKLADSMLPAGGKAVIDEMMARDAKMREETGRGGLDERTRKEYEEFQKLLTKLSEVGGGMMLDVLSAQSKSDELRAAFEKGSVDSMQKVMQIAGKTNESLNRAYDLYKTLDADGKAAVDAMIKNQAKLTAASKKSADAIAMARAEAQAMYKFAEMSEIMAKMEDDTGSLQSTYYKQWNEQGEGGRQALLAKMLGLDAGDVARIMSSKDGDDTARKAWEQLTKNKKFGGDADNVFVTDIFSNETEMKRLMAIIAADIERKKAADERQHQATLAGNKELEDINKNTKKPQDRNTQVRVSLESMAAFGQLGLAYKLG